MRSKTSDYDIVIITGANAVGKTTASNYLRKLAKQRGITCESRMISDSECLFQAMLDDDKAGGLHHTHGWCENSAGHIHDSGQPTQSTFPFTIRDNELPSKMRNTFFGKLETLESTGKLWFVEWAAGVNTNLPEDSASHVDYSYKLIRQLMHKGELSTAWLTRVRVVLHLTAEESVRHKLNEKRSIPLLALPEALEEGTASWLKDKRVIKFYGKDDFSEIEGIFDGIPIYTITNDGNSLFFQKLEEVAESVLTAEILEPV